MSCHPQSDWAPTHQNEVRFPAKESTSAVCFVLTGFLPVAAENIAISLCHRPAFKITGAAV